MDDRKLKIMLELERRGKLPEQKRAILGELRRRGVVAGDPGNESFMVRTGNALKAAGQGIMDYPYGSMMKVAQSGGIPLQLVKKGLMGASRGIDYAAGEMVDQEAQRGNMEYLAPAAMTGVSTLVQAAAESIPTTPLEAGLTALGGPGGQVAKSAVKKSLPKAVVAAGEKVAEKIAAAGATKIPLTVAEITQSPFFAGLEEWLARQPLSSGVMERFRQGRNNRLIELKNSFASKFTRNTALSGSESARATGAAAAEKAGEMAGKMETRRMGKLGAARDEMLGAKGARISPEKVGATAQNQALERSKVAWERKDRLYKEAEAALPDGPDTPVFPQNLMGEASTILQEFERTPSLLNPSVRATLTEIIPGPSKNPLGGEGMRGFTYRELDTLRSQLGALGNELRGQLKGQSQRGSNEVRRLLDAIDRDYDALSQSVGGEFKKKFTVAKDFYREGVKGVYGEDIPAIRNLTKKSPEDVYASIIKPGDVNDIRALKRAVGPQGLYPFQKKFMQEVVGESGSKVPAREEILERLEQYSPETIAEILPKPWAEQIRSFASTGKTPQFIESAIEKQMKALSKKNPQAVFDYLFKADPAEAKKLGAMLGPEVSDGMRRHMLERILGQDPDIIANPAAMKKAIEDMKGRLGAWFSPGDIAQMTRISNVRDITTFSQQMAGNPSQSGRAIIQGGFFNDLVSGSVMGAVTGAVPAMIARGYLSESGTNLTVKAYAKLMSSGQGRRMLEAAAKAQADMANPRTRAMAKAMANMLLQGED